MPSATWKVFFKFLNFAFSEYLIHLREIYIVLHAWSLSQIQRCNSFLMVYIKDYLHWNWWEEYNTDAEFIIHLLTSQSLCSFPGNSRTPKFQTSWRTLSSKVLCRQKILKVDPAMVNLPHRFQSRPTTPSQDQLISIFFWVIKKIEHLFLQKGLKRSWFSFCWEIIARAEVLCLAKVFHSKIEKIHFLERSFGWT